MLSLTAHSKWADSLQFGCLQWSTFHWLHTFQIAFQEEVWPLLPITTTASLSTTQKHFDWAVLVLLAYKKHLQVDYSKANFVPKCSALSTSLPFSGISSLLVKIPQITSYIISYIQVDKAIRDKFFIIGCNNLQYLDYLVPK